MATQNPITGDALVSRANTQKYSDNYDAIFSKKPTTPVIQEARFPDINPCRCGASNPELMCTGGHYAEDYVVCLDCRREGSGEFSLKDAIYSWNRENPCTS